VLDIGCGGGLISEGLSKIGATVTGIDFIKENINVAKIHAKKNNLKINYFVKDFEKEKITSKYDVIIILEVLEHLNNWEEFVKKIKLSLKKNGTLIISTINRNLVSKFLTLDIGENFLKLIPLNTHTFYKFIKPEELEQVLSSNNFENIKFKGLTYDALKLSWKLSENTKINYFCSCKLN
jgi:2-polyprenyl-6-hydroxyphenyl methylase/3-demethylubiquinone-9 3-methyltransferase